MATECSPFKITDFLHRHKGYSTEKRQGWLKTQWTLRGSRRLDRLTYQLNDPKPWHFIGPCKEGIVTKLILLTRIIYFNLSTVCSAKVRDEQTTKYKTSAHNSYARDINEVCCSFSRWSHSVFTWWSIKLVKNVLDCTELLLAMRLAIGFDLRWDVLLYKQDIIQHFN